MEAIVDFGPISSRRVIPIARVRPLDLLYQNYSHSQAKRLWRDGAVDVFDYRPVGNRVEEYRRRATSSELVEPGSQFVIGKHYVLTVVAKQYPCWRIWLDSLIGSWEHLESRFPVWYWRWRIPSPKGNA